MKQLVIAGGGFAGFWSAISAARQAEALGHSQDLKITLINRDAYLGIRPRYYEAEWEQARVPLKHWLIPLGIELVLGEISDVLPESQLVRLADGRNFSYDQLILATGSRLRLPEFPANEKLFNTDTYEQAAVLDRHIDSLVAAGLPTVASRTFVVLGGGLTGLELVTALPPRLTRLAPSARQLSFHLVDRGAVIGLGYEVAARSYIEGRLHSLGIHLHLGREMHRYQGTRVILDNGEELASETVVLATGVHASPLTAAFPVARDEAGRLLVDEFLRLPQHPNVIVAGDACKAKTDPDNWALMSCQHAMPQGKFAGHNAVNLLFGKDPITYSQPRYITCLDLGAEDALATVGWERRLNRVGWEAKSLKTEILTQWLYPPASIEETLALGLPQKQVIRP